MWTMVHKIILERDGAEKHRKVLFWGGAQIRCLTSLLSEKQVTAMSVIIFGDLLDTNEGQTFNTNERQSSMAYIKKVSPFQPKHRDVATP